MKKHLALTATMVFAFSSVFADESVHEDLQINEPTNVVVESGTTTWYGKLTGSGTITKEGAGTLLVASTNDNFSGNWVVKDGSLKTGSAINKVVKFLGTGKVTVYASTEHDSSIEVQTSILPNQVEVIGKSSVAHPAIKANGQTSYGALITADNDLYIYQTNYGSGTQPFANKLIFEQDGRIEAPGQLVSMRPDAQFDFVYDDNYIICDTLETTWDGGTKGAGSVRLGSNRNQIRLIRTSKARIICDRINCFGGAALGWYGQDTADGYTAYIISGYTPQTAAYLTSDECFSEGSCYSISNNPTASEVSELVLTGGVAEATAYCKLTGKLSLELSSTDGKAFRQRLLGRSHSMSGSITVNANSTLSLESGTRFNEVTQVNVNGGTLELADGQEFLANVVDFVFTNGGKIKLPASVQFVARSITVDGVEVSDNFTQSSAGTMVEGEGALCTTESLLTYLTWIATEETASVSAPASWQNSPAFDFSKPNYCLARFADAAAGARANVDAPVFWRGLEFFYPGDFTIADSGDNGSIALGAHGLMTVAAEPENARTYTIEVPVTAEAEQYWTPGENTTTEFTNFTVNAEVSMTNGHGTVKFSGVTTLNAPLKNWYHTTAAGHSETTDDLGRTMIITGEVQGEGTLSHYGWNGAKIILSNAVVRSPFYWYGTGSQDWAGSWFICPPNTTNFISGPLTAGSASYLRIENRARLEISGGGTFGNKISSYSSGTLVITNRPLDSSASNTDNNAFVGAEGSSSRFILAVASNRFTRAISSGANSVFEFGADYTVSEDCLQTVRNNCIDIDGTSTSGRFEFNDTHQLFRSLRNNRADKTGVTLHGVYPASLGVYLNSTNHASITGWLALEKLSDEKIGGDDQELVLAARAHESYGDLKVSGGTLKFLEGATWANGTNVTVCGTGTLKLASPNTFSSRHAVLHVSEQGKLDIPEGVLQAFHEVYVDDALVRSGTYTPANPGPLDGHFAATAAGGIIVRSQGVRIILK